jgi:hypothetical protein
MKILCPKCKTELKNLRNQFYCPNKKCETFKRIQIGSEHGNIIEEE